MGLGLLGRGVGDTEFLAQCGADVIVTDLKSRVELEESAARLDKLPNVQLVLGEHRNEDFENRDFIIKAAGVPASSTYLEHAIARGVPVTMSTAMFASLAMGAGVTVVGITGTRGKTTVSNMIYRALKSKPSVVQGKERHVFLGGNIRGISTLAMLPDVLEGDAVVLELDSWQLQGFGEEQISPHIAVFTNFYPDHMDYYKDMDEYFLDKSNIFKYQDEQAGNTLIIGEQLADKVKKAAPPVEPIVSVPLPEEWQLRVPGAHNRENASLAREALGALGMPDGDIQVALEQFRGVEGRLQHMGDTESGVKIYNDNNATTPEATVAALRSFEYNSVVLIIGGCDKHLDMSELVRTIPMYCSKVVLFNESGTDRIRNEIKSIENIDVYEEEGLENTIKRAMEVAESGEVVLYSPAFSSFGKYFKNEYERGDQFIKLIEKHIKRKV